MVLTTSSQLSASHFKRYRGSDKCGAVFRSIGDLPACFCMGRYRKTPLISTYVFSGLATEQVLIFGAVLTFGGYDKSEAKILQGRSLFKPVLSAHNTLLCMFQRLCRYFQDTGVLIFGGYVLSGALQPTANFSIN